MGSNNGSRAAGTTGAATSVTSSTDDKPPSHSSPESHSPSRFWPLMIGSIGVVYGDIGTSPLYAFRETMTATMSKHGGLQRADVIGVLSLILWALTIIVTCKYVLLLLRADNDGEGGTLSLMALARRCVDGASPVIFFLGVAGAALFYGDAIITPAISVLSAVEGLRLVTPRCEPFILPLTAAIIISLFLVQSRGTARVAAYFGPITTIWFVVIAAGGLFHIADAPFVFHALNPVHAVKFIATNGVTGLTVLGTVFLAVTGAEALYADLGHFGRRPIKTAWLALVFPALALNYLGQGALVLAHPEAIKDPFYFLFPERLLIPIVILATVATVIASQAVITGAYSLTRQAIQLRLLPRLDIQHTSETQEGQIYIPQVNLLLMVGVLLLVFMFSSSSRLAAAYGISVSGTMVVTACLAFVVVWRGWNWPVWKAALLLTPFLVIDLTFLGANLLKIWEGGYVSLLFSVGLMGVMGVWVRGTDIVNQKTRKGDIPLIDLVRNLEEHPPPTVAGTAVFLTRDTNTAPAALLHSLKHYRVLHEKNVMVTVFSANTPRVPNEERVRTETIGEKFLRITMTFGYMEEPNVPQALASCRTLDWKYNSMTTSFFVSRWSIKSAPNQEMPAWMDKLFIFLFNNASDATEYFRIPTGRVVEIGAQVTV